MAAPNPSTEILAATAAPNSDSVRRFKLAVDAASAAAAAASAAAAAATAAQAAFVDNLGTEILAATAAPNPDSTSRFKIDVEAAVAAAAASRAASAAAAAQTAFVDNADTEILAATTAAVNPASEILAAQAAVGLNSERRNEFSVAEHSRKFSAAIAAVGSNPGAEIVARGTEILANAFVAPKTFTEFVAARTAVGHPEYRRQLAAAVAFIAANPGTHIPDDSVGGLTLDKVTAITAKAAAATVKVERYYIEFAKKLFEPLEDAKRFFVVEKDAFIERLQKEKDAFIERLQKEKDEITERLQKEKDELTERLQKGKDEVTERLQKGKDEVTERLHKEKESINAKFQYSSKRARDM